MRIIAIAILLFFNSCVKAQTAFFPALVSDAPVLWNVNDGLVIGELPYKLKGVNFAPSFATIGLSEREVFVEWETVFPTYIQPLVDHAINDLGVNFFRIIGAPVAVFDGTLTLEVYLERYAEFIEFLRTKNCYVEATAGGWQNMKMSVGGSYASDADAQAHMVAFALMANDYPNVVGIDLMQEFNGYYESGGRSQAQVTAIITNTIAECKSEGVTKPLTFSVQPWGTYDNMFGLSWWTTLGPLVDYLDPHLYYIPTNLNGLDLITVYGKPILIGETGVMRPGHGDLSYGGARNSYINTWRTTFQADERHVGFSWWCLNDRDEFYWGLLHSDDGEPFDEDDVADFKEIPIPEIVAP